MVLIANDESPLTFGEWVKTIENDEPVDMGVSAAELLADARAAGEV